MESNKETDVDIYVDKFVEDSENSDKYYRYNRGKIKSYIESVLLEYYNKLVVYRNKVLKINKENKKRELQYKKDLEKTRLENNKLKNNYNKKLREWNKLSFFNRLFNFNKKPKLLFKKKPKLVLLKLPKSPKKPSFLIQEEIKYKYKIKGKCSICGASFNRFSEKFKCHYCRYIYCTKHRQAENHNCYGELNILPALYRVLYEKDKTYIITK